MVVFAASGFYIPGAFVSFVIYLQNLSKKIFIACFLFKKLIFTLF